MRVCLSVPARIFVTTRPTFTSFSVLVSQDRRSVLLGQRSATLRISAFTDDVIFAHKLRLRAVAAELRQRGSHAALGLSETRNAKLNYFLRGLLRIRSKFTLGVLTSDLVY